jgi:hypothetical protein
MHGEHRAHLMMGVMQKYRVNLSLLLSLVSCCTGAAFALPAQSAADLVKDVAYNELHDRERLSFWQYRIEKTTAERTVTEQQVETAQGPIFRTIQIAGQPLDSEQKRQEDDRLQSLMRSPSAQRKNREQHEQDEDRLRRLIALMPQAFLYSYAGEPAGNLITLNFRPNPAFTPSTYEARVFHGLTGTIVVDMAAKRLVDLRGTTTDRIDFGYGLLGHVEKGGRFEVKRGPVSPDHWKTQFVEVHLDGRLLFFKTISKDQRELRSGFSPVPADITLVQAAQLLNASITSPAASAPAK